MTLTDCLLSAANASRLSRGEAIPEPVPTPLEDAMVVIRAAAERRESGAWVDLGEEPAEKEAAVTGLRLLGYHVVRPERTSCVYVLWEP